MSDCLAIEAGRRHPADSLCLDLIGPLRLRGTDGSDLTPRGRKAQGLLALVGTAPGLRRSRAWLQDKLWSDRGTEQGASSLRQCLTEIRSALGRHVDCFETDRTWVAFDPDRIRVRKDCGPLAALDVEFLEGLDIRDPEFEHWIRDKRMSFTEQHECNTGTSGLVAGSSRHPNGTGPAIGLVSRTASGCQMDGLLADQMIESVAAALLERPAMEVVDLRNPLEWGASFPAGSGPDWLLRATASMWRGRVRIALTLTEVSVARLHWTETRVFDVDAFYGRDDPNAVMEFARHAADCVAAGTGTPQTARRRAGTPLSIAAARAA